MEKIANRKTVRIFVDKSAKTDLESAEIAPEQILAKIIAIYREDNCLDFNYDLKQLSIGLWHHRKPPKQFWGNSYGYSLHDFLFSEAENKIRIRNHDVIFVFTGDLWVGSGISYLGTRGDGILLIGTKNQMITPFDWLMNRACLKYIIEKTFNIFRFFILRPIFLWKSKRDMYLLALAATCAHEQAHAFGIHHSNSYSMMSYANM